MGILKNEKGQMAVFVALFFQVIFVFFAMAINVGLVVHDKINLQNSVDIAAYYGAMKQAEVLNQMAHINYQMRQNYKLFVWRYRVLGTIGNKNHPMNFNSILPNPTQEAPSWDPSWPNNQVGNLVPTVCVSHSYWKELQELDQNAASICQDNAKRLPAVPTFAAPVGLVPGAGNLQSSFAFLSNQLQRFCLEASVMNWFYSARILAHFRIDGLMRKRMMYKLASNLSQPDPLDIKGESIRTGVEKTLTNNLTNTNAASISGGTGSFQYINSLSSGQCAQPTFWLPEIKINPVIFYSDWDNDNSSYGGTSDVCQEAIPTPNRNDGVDPAKTTAPQGHASLPSAFTRSVFGPRLGNALTQYLIPFWVSEPPDNGGLDTHSSIGFEKNPWCMIYSGVQATTVVRKPFDPLGTGVQLTARGFAKPFGGRIGPWYGKSWPAGTATSQATDRSEMVDGLLPSRTTSSGAAIAGSFDDVANYSRFPGDTLGMNSKAAISSMAQAMIPFMAHGSAQQDAPFAIGNYDHIGSETNLIVHNDGLARRRQNPVWQAKQRPFELASVAPNPFDAFYYSIEPRYHDNYFSSITTNEGLNNFAIDQQLWDIGSGKDNYAPQVGLPPRPQFNIQNQIDHANGTTPSVGNPPVMQNYPHLVRDWQHLLTSWHQKGSIDYDFDNARFGTCSAPIENHSSFEFPVPSSCLIGGRTGYSVKLISRDYLESSDHSVGGDGGGAGGLLNPPSNFGF